MHFVLNQTLQGLVLMGVSFGALPLMGEDCARPSWYQNPSSDQMASHFFGYGSSSSIEAAARSADQDLWRAIYRSSPLDKIKPEDFQLWGGKKTISSVKVDEAVDWVFLHYLEGAYRERQYENICNIVYLAIKVPKANVGKGLRNRSLLKHLVWFKLTGTEQGLKSEFEWYETWREHSRKIWEMEEVVKPSYDLLVDEALRTTELGSRAVEILREVLRDYQDLERERDALRDLDAFSMHIARLDSKVAEIQLLDTLCNTVKSGNKEKMQTHVNTMISYDLNYAPMLRAVLSSKDNMSDEEAAAVMSDLNASAKSGFAPSYVLMGDLYRIGNGVRKSNKRALEYYREAGASGSQEGYLESGKLLYRGGVGLKRNRVQAKKYLEKAAEMGSTEAATFLKSKFKPNKSRKTQQRVRK